MYLKFEEYKQLGGKADGKAFPLLSRLAEKQLDFWTMNRLKNVPPTEDIRLCMTLIVDFLDEEKTGDQGITSFSNDGVSVTYAEAKTADQKKNEVYKKIVQILPVKYVSAVIDDATNI